MSKYTLLEFHLHDGSVRLGPKSLDVAGGDISGGEDASAEESAGDGDGDGTAEESSGRAVLGLLAVIVVAVLVALAAKKFAGGDGDEAGVPEDLESLDDLS